MTELRECPFCGQQPEKREHTYWTGMRNEIMRVDLACGDTDFRGHRVYAGGKTLEEAAERWNRRAEPDRNVEPVAYWLRDRMTGKPLNVIFGKPVDLSRDERWQPLYAAPKPRREDV